MYITTPIDKSPQVAQPQCPAQQPCVQPLQIYVSGLGLAFALSCLAAFLLRQKLFRHVRSKSNIFLSHALLFVTIASLLFAALYLLKAEYRPGMGPIEGVLVRSRLLPDLWPPLLEIYKQ